MATKMLQTLTWRDVEELNREKTYCVFPISSLEQHGVHLPVGTDDFILEIALESLKNAKINKDLLIMPPLKYGKSIEHLNFAGTVTLKAETLIAIVKDIFESMSYNGFKKFIIINSHGGNTLLLRSIAQDLCFMYDVKVYNIDLWSSNFFDEVDFIQAPLESEVHGGEIETSLLMFKHPDIVKIGNCLEDELKAVVNFNENDFSWLSSDFSRYGIIGDARLSSKETGEKLVAYIAQKLTSLINKID